MCCGACIFVPGGVPITPSPTFLCLLCCGTVCLGTPGCLDWLHDQRRQIMVRWQPTRCSPGATLAARCSLPPEPCGATGLLLGTTFDAAAVGEEGWPSAKKMQQLAIQCWRQCQSGVQVQLEL
eukprot:jgi/Ulvmu1/12262/UM086_0055.1